MAQIHWKFKQFQWKLQKQNAALQDWFQLLRMTLFYNHFTSWSYAMETAFEPLFCCVDRFAKYLGPVSSITIYYHIYTNHKPTCIGAEMH